jgi:uncharacterized protein (DUF1778 family)
METARTTKSARKGKREERLEVRGAREQKMLFERAADIQGRKVSDFVVVTLTEAATRTVREHESMVLSARDREVFVSALLNPPRLQKGRLAEAAARYRRLTK